jgi:hypothetical protein
MRSPLAVLAMLSIAACVGPGTYTVVPQSTPAPVQRPALSPMEITIVRPEAGKLLVQTNRAAYVALFEIVPDRGVALIYPTSPRQQSARMAGLSWLPIGWTMTPASNDRGRYGRDGDRVRHVFALASDRPFRLSDEAYDDAYLRRVLGPTAYRASDPEYTMRALSRQFLRVMPSEEWGQDLYTLEAPASRAPYRWVRVSCPDGSMYEVREEVALRMHCTNRGPASPTIPPRIADVPVRTPPQTPPARSDTARNPRIPIFGGTLRGPQRDTTRLGRGEPANDGDGGRSEPQQQGDTKPRTEPNRPNVPPYGRPDAPGSKADTKRDEHAAKKDEHDARKEEERDAREERKADQREAREERKADQREVKEERKEDKREEKSEQREVKQEQQQEKKAEQREAKEEKKEEKTEVKQEKSDDKAKSKGPSWSRPRPPSAP